MAKFDAEYWAEELRHAIIYKENSIFYDEWGEYERLYRNDYKDDILPYNVHYALGRVTVANTYGATPYINVVPTRPAFAPFSRVVESVANYFVGEHEVADNMRTIALDTFLYGLGINSTGFMPSEPIGPKDMAREIAGEGKLRDITYDTTRRPGHPWEERVKPRDFLVAYGTRRLYRARWAAELVTTLTDELEETDGFIKSKIKTTSYYGSANPERPEEREAEEKFTKYWRIHDARTKQIFYMPYMDRIHAPEIKGFIRPPETDPTQIDGLPFASVMFNDDPDFFWLTPDSAILMPFARELTEIKTQVKYHRALAILRFFVAAEYIEKEDMAKLMDNPADVGAFIRVKDVEKVAEIVSQFVPHIPAEQLLMVFDHSRADLREIFGASRNTMGEVSTGRRSASEAKIAFGQQAIRFDERREAMAQMLEKTVRKKLQYAFSYWGQEQVMPILGYDGMVSWVRFKPQDIAAEFKLKIDSETMAPMTKKTKRAETMELLSVLANMPNINLVPVLSELIHQSSWFDVMQLLPQANPAGEPMALSQFEGGQQKALETNNNSIRAFAG